MFLKYSLNENPNNADQGRGPGGCPPSSVFDQNEARRAQKIFLETAPPPLSQGLDDRPQPPPPYLKVWIRTFRSLFRATDTCDIFSFYKDACHSLKLSASLEFFFRAMLSEHLNTFSCTY